MSSRRCTTPLSIVFLLTFAVLFAFFAQPAFAIPAPTPLPEPTSPTIGEVIGDNRNMACMKGACYYQVNSTDTAKSIVAESATPSASESAAPPNSANSATFNNVILIWPVVVAGSTLLLVL